MEKNYIAADTLTAIRDSLSGDSQLRHFELRRKAVDLRMHVVDLERALAELPAAPKLTGAARDAADLADLRARRDRRHPGDESAAIVAAHAAGEALASIRAGRQSRMIRDGERLRVG